MQGLQQIKTEPIDDGYEDTSTSSLRQQQVSNIQNLRKKSLAYTSDPRISSENRSSSVIYEGLRNIFLEKNISAQEVLELPKKNEAISIQSIMNAYNRAKTVSDNLNYDTEDASTFSSFSANVPKNIRENESRTGQFQQRSPTALQSRQYQFQMRTTDLDDVAGPYNVSFETQRISKRIGANLDALIDENSGAQSSKRLRADTVEQTNHRDERLEFIRSVEHRETQTDSDSGDFVLVIPCAELQNLDQSKKTLLKQIMKQFSLKDSRKLTDMLDRIAHRSKVWSK